MGIVLLAGSGTAQADPLPPPEFTLFVAPTAGAPGQMVLNVSFTNNFGGQGAVNGLSALLTLAGGATLAGGQINPVAQGSLADGALWLFPWTVNVACPSAATFDVAVNFTGNPGPAFHFGPAPLCGGPGGPQSIYTFLLQPTPAGFGQISLNATFRNEPGGQGTLNGLSADLQLGDGLELVSGADPATLETLNDGMTWPINWLINVGCGPDSFFDVFVDFAENPNLDGAPQLFHYPLNRPDCPPPPEVDVDAPFTTPDGLPLVFSGVPTAFGKDVVDHCIGKKPVKAVKLVLHPEFGPDVEQMLEYVGPGEVWSKTFLPSGHGITSLTFYVTCDDDSIEIQDGGNIYIDPSGTIVDACTGDPLAGATVTLIKETSPGIFGLPPAGQFIPAVNPQITAADGAYGWDVVAGNWQVHAEKFGYASADSAVLAIPPAVTDLEIALTPTGGCVTPPANDDFANAIVLAGNNGSVNGTTVDATNESGEPNPAHSVGVWYSWTPVGTGTVTFDTCGGVTDYDTYLNVYTGVGLASLTQIAENDDFCSGFFGFRQSEVMFAFAGQTYWIRVGGFGINTGDFTLNFVVFVDNTAPVIQPHANVQVVTNDAGATSVSVGYTPPDVTDDTDPTHPAFCTPGPGAFFAVGAHTQVTCTAQDVAGNPAAPTFFDVFVEFVDNTKPVIRPHGDEHVTTADPGGTVVFYDSPLADDDADGILATECFPLSGSNFAIGHTTVTCDVQDSSGNEAVDSFFDVFVELDAEGSLDALRADVLASDLKKGLRNDLENKLEQAAKELDKKKGPKLKQACKKLDDFVDQLAKKTGKQGLTAAQAAEWRDWANAIALALGC
ncbi:MAG: HYR domain-containing protein [Gaiellaceae bacterium]